MSTRRHSLWARLGGLWLSRGGPLSLAVFGLTLGGSAWVALNDGADDPPADRSIAAVATAEPVPVTTTLLTSIAPLYATFGSAPISLVTVGLYETEWAPTGLTAVLGVDPPIIEQAPPPPAPPPPPPPEPEPEPQPTPVATPVRPVATAVVRRATPVATPVPQVQQESAVVDATPEPVQPQAAAPAQRPVYRGALTVDEFYAALARSPWPEELWPAVLRIARCESGLNPSAVGAGVYIGLMQMHYSHARGVYNLYDVDDNLAAAYYLWAARGWGQWGCR